MHAFAPIDLMLVSSGCGILRTGLIYKIINRFIRMIVIMTLIPKVVLLTLRLFRQTIIRPLMYLEYASESLFVSLFLVVMTLNGRKLADSLNVHLNSVSPGQKIHLKKTSLIFLVLGVIIRVMEIGATTVHIIASKADLRHASTDLITQILMKQWLIGGCFLYAFLVKLHACMEDNFFQKLHKFLATTGAVPKNRNPDLKSLTRERWTLMNERESLFSLLSVIPVTWFVYFFIEAASAITDSMNTSNADAERVTSLLPLFAHAGVLFYLIWLCDSVSSAIRKREKEMITILMNDSTDSSQQVIDQLKESSEIEFTAWSMFDLNRKFVMSFISSFITFTVLFIQIASKGKN